MVANEFTQAVIDLVESAQQRADAEEAQTLDRQLEVVEGVLEDRSTEVLADEFQRRVTEAREAEPANSSEALASLLGELPEESQEVILEPLNPDDVEEPADVREALQQAEGGAVGQAAAVLAGTIALETASAGQVESQQFLVSQVLTFLALEDVLGLELETTVAEGVQPLLQQKVNEEYRSKQADLQDVVEQQLRSKDSDVDYLGDLARYGIKPEDVPILEQVALNAVEFEELIETPAELGLVVDDEVLQDELDRAGYAEDTKDFFSRTNDAIRRSARVYQELLVSEDLVSTLDTLVEDGVIDPEEAVARIPDEVDAEDSAFRQRFQLLAEQEAGTPSRSQFETSFANGFSTLETLRERLDETAYPTGQFDDVVDATLLDELDGDLQRAVGLGLIDETTYANLAEDLGLDDETVDRLLRGEDLGDIAERRLTEQTPPEERSVETIVGIGQSRAAALRAADVETVDDLARERPEEIASVVDVTPEAAQEFVERAVRRVQGR
jgi:hypothetical protein